MTGDQPEFEQLVDLPAVSLGRLIADRRRELGHSQRDLADRICAASGRQTVTRHEISRYERETRVPSRAWLGPLATALELPLPAVSQAARFATARRWLSDAHQLSAEPCFGNPSSQVAQPAAPLPSLLPALIPGYLIGTRSDGIPQPMIFTALALSTD